MEKEKIAALLKAFKTGRVTLPQALEQLKHLPFEDLGFARVDHHRSLRLGFPEVVYCAGKTIPQSVRIFQALEPRNPNILLTRASPELYAGIARIAPKTVYHEAARLITLTRKKSPRRGLVLVACAGTSDIPVAEEAALTAEISGSRVERLYDAGVAGLHRLTSHLDILFKARCVVAVAGMEGALPSVLGGLAACPIIAVPTSVGYGTHLGGLAPLFTMLNSCAPNVSVVNIDNGFGAGFLATLINRR